MPFCSGILPAVTMCGRYSDRTAPVRQSRYVCGWWEDPVSYRGFTGDRRQKFYLQNINFLKKFCVAKCGIN